MADQLIDLKIPDIHKADGLEAINALTDVPIMIECHDLFDHGGGHYSVNITSKDVSETDKEFAERWACTLIKTVFKMYFIAKDSQRFSDEVASLDPINQNVHEDIVMPQ